MGATRAEAHHHGMARDSCERWRMEHALDGKPRPTKGHFSIYHQQPALPGSVRKVAGTVAVHPARDEFDIPGTGAGYGQPGPILGGDESGYRDSPILADVSLSFQSLCPFLRSLLSLTTIIELAKVQNQATQKSWNWPKKPSFRKEETTLASRFP